MRWTAAILGMGFLVWYAFGPRAREPARTDHSSGDSIVARRSVEPRHAPPSESGAARFTAVLFPYSVIPGGVESVAELRSVLARDPLVATHYKGFDLAQARLARMDQPRVAYVSYRLGEHIYWTSHKLTLRKGETVITDGAHTARTRCGNLVAEFPVGPLSPREPTPEIFDTPLPLDMPMGPRLEIELPPISEWMPEAPTIGTEPPGSEDYVGILPVPFPIVGGGGIVLPVIPAVPTPEPSAFFLIFAGLAILVALRRARKSCVRQQ